MISSPAVDQRDEPSRLGRLVVGACATVVALLAACAASGAVDPVAMPTAPRWLTAAAAVGAAAVVLSNSRADSPPGHARLALAGVAGTLLLAGSLLAIPHTVLMAFVWVAARVTGGSGSFDVEPVWLVSLTHLTVVAAASLVAAWLVAGRRRGRGRCVRCGRTDPHAPAVGERWRRAVPWLAAVSIVAAVPYAVLKIAWSLGSRVGLVGHAFDDVTLASPGFGDTVVLTGISVVVSIVLGLRVRTAAVRLPALAVGALGSVMLLPAGLAGAAMLIPLALGVTEVDDSEIAPWAFATVYVSFLIWGLALAGLTICSWRVTRQRCRRHVPAPAPAPIS